LTELEAADRDDACAGSLIAWAMRPPARRVVQVLGLFAGMLNGEEQRLLVRREERTGQLALDRTGGELHRLALGWTDRRDDEQAVVHERLMYALVLAAA